MFLNAMKILECSRVFALPTTVFSWLVIYVYSVINFGNAFYGFLSLLGMVFAHLATNLLDDYFDYKSLIKAVNFNKEEYLKNSQKTKCRYLINGMLKEKDVVIISIIYLLLASFIGIYLYFKCGINVLYFMLLAGVLMLLYPFLSKIKMSEIVVFLTYGPILFGGVFYVMTGTMSGKIYLLMLPSAIMTTVLLYIHTVMDYKFDENEGKKTIANSFKSQSESLIVLKIMLIMAYISILSLCIFDILNWQVLFTFITIPLAKDLYQSLNSFAYNPTENPPHKWYHFPMENMKFFTMRNEASFMIRIYQARNLMMYFSLCLVIGIFLSLAM